MGRLPRLSVVTVPLSVTTTRPSPDPVAEMRDCCGCVLVTYVVPSRKVRNPISTTVTLPDWDTNVTDAGQVSEAVFVIEEALLVIQEAVPRVESPSTGARAPVPVALDKPLST